MHSLKSLLALATLLLVASWISQQAPFSGLDQLWRAGKLNEAQEIVAANVRSGNTTPEFLWDAAVAMEAGRQFSTAAELFMSAAIASADNLELVRKAKEREYYCRFQSSDANPEAPWITAETLMVEQMLTESEGGRGPHRKLALELEFLLQNTLDLEAELSIEIAMDYPDSEVVLRVATQLADAISAERNPEKRLELIGEFLEKFPKNYWRHVVYRYWLYYAWQSRKMGDLLDVSATYLAEYPDHPESLGVVSRYLFEADIEPEQGMTHARRSVELYETLIGLDGLPASLKRIQQETKHTPRQPDHHLPTMRKRFTNYLGSRFNLGRYLNATDQPAQALELVLPIIALKPYTMDEDQTIAPFYLVAGRAELALENLPGAYRNFLGAVVHGDSRNRYALQAEQEMGKIEDKLSASEMQGIRDEYKPVTRNNLVMPLFTDVTKEMGLAELKHRRIAWGDIDNDGDPDLLLDGHVLMGNDKGVRFGNATRGWKLIGPAGGGLFADYDNDGDLDIYAIAGAGEKDRLWRNEGAHFVDLTSLAGNPSGDLASEGAAWLDYDNDGWVDLYVANYQDTASGQNLPDRLYRNNLRIFETISPASLGMATPFGENLAGQGVCMADFDADGDQDIFVGNYRLQENLLWENNNDGFTNAGRLQNLAGRSIDSWWGHTIGSAWGDVDNDGDLDLFSANLAHPRYSYFSDKSMLLINGGATSQPRFHDQRAGWGVKFEETHAEPAFFDANNDGFLDLYITSTYANRRSFLYLNDGRGKFHDVTYLAGARVFDGWSCAWADYDSDGDLDLAVGSASGMRLLRNDTENGTADANHWLVVHCVGSQKLPSLLGSIFSEMTPDDTVATNALSNKSAIGARVTLTAGGSKQIREIQSGKGSTTGNQLFAHFGLGNHTGEMTLEVRFPSGVVVTKSIPGPDMLIVIQETIPINLPGNHTPSTQNGEATEDSLQEDDSAVKRENPVVR